MTKRATMLAATLVTLVGLTVPLVGASAQATPARPDIFPSEWCGNQAAPCVVSASRNGVLITESDPTYAVSATGSLQSDGEFLTQWGIADAKVPGSFATLAPGDAGVPFSITVDVGQHRPRVVDEYADGVSVSDTFDSVAGTWDVTVSGTAVEQGVNADCDATTWTCPANETSTIVAFQGEIGDWQQWSDSSQWNDFDGLDQWTNAELTEIPPQITGNPLTISEELGNSHELNGQVFEGFWDGVLPNAVLVDMGINDPSTLTPAGISASVGTGTVTVTPGPTSTKIAITGITFSPRMVHIKRGTITPNAPAGLSTRRASATVADLTFRAARPRGSYVRSYQGRCLAAHHPTRYGAGSRSPVEVTSLIRGVNYNCQVRAKASVGYGPWSNLTAARAASVASLTLSRSPVAYGHENAEKLTVKVASPLGGTPAGTVTIKIKSTVLCTIRLANGSGNCTLPAKRLKPGTYSLTASYSGSTYYTGTSAIKTLKVTG
jgi:Bacterial Ig-like domain (group 3)